MPNFDAKAPVMNGNTAEPAWPHAAIHPIAPVSSQRGKIREASFIKIGYIGPSRTPTIETATAPPTREGTNQTTSSSLIRWDYVCGEYKDWYKYTLSPEMRRRIARGVRPPVIYQWPSEAWSLNFRGREFTNLFTQRRATRPTIRPEREGNLCNFKKKGGLKRTAEKPGRNVTSWRSSVTHVDYIGNDPAAYCHLFANKINLPAWIWNYVSLPQHRHTPEWRTPWSELPWDWISVWTGCLIGYFHAPLVAAQSVTSRLKKRMSKRTCRENYYTNLLDVWAGKRQLVRPCSRTQHRKNRDSEMTTGPIEQIGSRREELLEHQRLESSATKLVT